MASMGRVFSQADHFLGERYQGIRNAECACAVEEANRSGSCSG